MNEIKLDTLIESWACGFGRVVAIGNGYFDVSFPNVLYEDKIRTYTPYDLKRGVIKIHEE